MDSCTASQAPVSVRLSGYVSGSGHDEISACDAFRDANPSLVWSAYNGNSCVAGSTFASEISADVFVDCQSPLDSSDYLFYIGIIFTIFIAFILGYRQGRAGV